MPPSGGLFLLPRMIGLGRAAPMVLRGVAVKAQEAERIGLAGEVVTVEALPVRGRQLARELACMAPLACAAVKQALHRGLETGMEAEWSSNAVGQGVPIGTEDFREGLDAARFRRQASFRGRWSSGPAGASSYRCLALGPGKLKICAGREKRPIHHGTLPLDQFGDQPIDAADSDLPLDTRRENAAVRAPLRLPKTAEVVADRIRKRIIRGELREGDFLPPEGQVLASLGISRPTLREAFRILEAENLISVLRGSRSGARVHQPKVETASRYAGFVLQAQATTVADIYEARLAIEPYVARRLAEHPQKGAIERLRAQTELLRAMVDEERYIDFMIALAEFHSVLVEVSGVRTLLFVTQLLQEVVARHQVRFFEINRLPQDEQRRRSIWGIRSFEKLIALIEAGQGDRAESHWRLHITNANAAWVPKGRENDIVNVFE